jgi:hypothetical protein
MSELTAVARAIAKEHEKLDVTHCTQCWSACRKSDSFTVLGAGGRRRRICRKCRDGYLSRGLTVRYAKEPLP